MLNKRYNLPEISFHGGGSEEFYFDLYNKEYEPLETPGLCTVNFDVISYSNMDYTSPIIHKVTNNLIAGEEGVNNRVVVSLNREDTLHLYGKFIYQITIIDDSTGVAEPAGQGIMEIYRNINP